jgi:hypothetical protein
LTSPSHRPARRRAWLPVLGPLLLAGAVATGCSATSASPSPAASGSSSPGSQGSQASFRQCLQRQGVSLPQGRPSAGGGQPRARPTGSAASAFRKAMKACGGGGFPGGGFHGGGNPPG